VLAYIIALTIFVKTPEMFKIPSFFVILLILLTVFITIGLLHLLNKIYLHLNKTIYVLCLILLTVLPRLVWILLVDTIPVSDFKLYQSYAENASNGVFNSYDPTYPLFPFKFGYPLVLSIIYRIFGTNIIYAKLFNIILSIGLSLLILWIGSMINYRTGQTAGIVFAFWPAQIMYCSVLASEHIFILLLVLAFGLFIKLCDNVSVRKKYVFLSAIGLVTAIAHFIRPITLIIFPIFFIYLLFTNTNKHILKDFLNALKTVIFIIVVFVVSYSLIAYPLSNLIGTPIWRSSSGFSFLIGTNSKTSGTYNAEEENILYEFNYDYNKIHKEAFKRAVNRIFSDPLQFASIVEKKYITQWSNEDYGYYWSTLEIEKTNKLTDFLVDNPGKLLAITQFYYLILLIFSLVGYIYMLKNPIYKAIPLALIFLFILALHTFFEAQSRYHYPVMPFLIIISSYGFEQLQNKLIVRTGKQYNYQKNLN